MNNALKTKRNFKNKDLKEISFFVNFDFRNGIKSLTERFYVKFFLEKSLF